MKLVFTISHGETPCSPFSKCILGWRRSSLLALSFLGCALLGCSSLPKPRAEWNEPRNVDLANTTWARALAPEAARHPGDSGVQLLEFGYDALAARLALLETAERTLDVQYYAWKPDAVGRMLTYQMLRAADRGVLVRLLLDDMGGTASDEVLLALDTHTNIQVRLFNPVANRTFRRTSIALNFRRITRRMHNKSFTVDNAVTILGGRNVEGRYYGIGDERQFADADVLAAGPAAAEVAAMFDRYWTNSSAIPIRALLKKKLNSQELEEGRDRLAESSEAFAALPVFIDLATNEAGQSIRRHDPNLTWCPAQLVWDQPEKITADLDDTSTHMLPELRETVEETTKEVIIISPYFIPGDKGVEFICALRKRGIRVVILSNSLASTDATPMHVGYRRYRKPLLRAGVEMWELKPDVRLRTSTKGEILVTHHDREPESSLHSKSFIFDRQTIFVGSLNLDPHSVVLNTEMGLIIKAPALSKSTADILEATLPQKAYRLEFVPSTGPCTECGTIVWHSEENGKDVVYHSEPKAGFSRQLLVFLLSFLPIESQL